MPNGGWYQLDRHLWARLGREAKPLERLLLTHLMVSVHYADGREPVMVPGEGRRTLVAGELVSSCVKLADEVDLSERTVRRILTSLNSRWDWLAIRVRPGRVGASGVYVAIDIEAAKAWATDDRTESPVSGGSDRTESPVTARPDRESGHNRTESPVSATLDRTESPKDVEPAVTILKEQARRSRNVSCELTGASAPAPDTNGASGLKQQTANALTGSAESRLWDQITSTWSCTTPADTTARAEALAAFARDPMSALAVARGVNRDPRALWKWRCFRARSYAPADGDRQWVSDELNRDRPGSIGSIADALNAACASVADVARAPPACGNIRRVQ